MKKPKYGFIAPTKSVFPVFMEMLKANYIKPVIDKIIDFNEKDIREAINYVRTHRATGKVVIKINHT